MTPWKFSDLPLVICHRRPDRSFSYKGKPFPLCARCTGTAIGFLSLPLFALKMLALPFSWILILILPAWIDGATQASGWRESNNWLRLATGLLLGVAQMGLAALCGDWLLQQTGLLDYFR